MYADVGTSRYFSRHVKNGDDRCEVDIEQKVRDQRRTDATSLDCSKCHNTIVSLYYSV